MLEKSLLGSPSESITNPHYSEVYMVQAAILAPGQIRHLLRVTDATSRHPERDCLVVLLGITCGMRVSEIAQIEVQDVLFASRAVRAEVSLRAAITKGCRQRCIYMTHKQTLAALIATWGIESRSDCACLTRRAGTEACGRTAS
jgi:site-specific recombinase XerD